jgi:hypothetical protein
MELSWYLAGLAHAVLASPMMKPSLLVAAEKTYDRLKRNQGRSGLFGHLSTTKSVAGLIRGAIGSFADQIYPIYAMSKYAVAFRAEEASRRALKCADVLCSSQGELGQWWWLYHANTGKILSRYPVYSVHQQGMAPMGLFALEQATGQQFKHHVRKGLNWIYGTNELSMDMRDLTDNVIWRCILPKAKHSKYSNLILNIIGLTESQDVVKGLHPLLEDRPYELGWLLLAFGKYGFTVEN